MRLAARIGLLSITVASAAAQPQPPVVIWEQAVRARSVAFSTDGQYVASGGVASSNPFTFGRVDLWAAADGIQLAHREVHGAPGTILGLAGDVDFSADGARLASAHGSIYCAPKGGCTADRAGLYTWSVPGLTPLAAGDPPSPVSSIAFAPDDLSLAAAYFYDNDGAVRQHDPVTLDVTQTLSGHQYVAADVSYRPDGTSFASVGDDGLVRIWDAATGDILRALFHGDYVDGGEPVSVAFSPDGQFIAAGGNGYDLKAKVWRVSNGVLVHEFDAALAPDAFGTVVVEFSPNGAYLVGGYEQYDPNAGWLGRLVFWDLATGGVAAEYEDTGPPPYFGGVTAIALSPAHNHRFSYVAAGVVKMAETALQLSESIFTAGEDDPVAGFRLSVEGANPSATPTLALVVARTQRVRAEALDALGRRVALLVDGSVSAGSTVPLVLDGGLAPGAYVVRVTGETFAASRNVTVAR